MRGSGVLVLIVACSGGLGSAFGMMVRQTTAPTVESLLVRGRAELDRGRADAALTLWMGEAPKLVDSTEVWFEAGVVARRLGRHSEAASAFERVPRESPLWRDSVGELGLACLSLGELDEAERLLREAIRLRSASPAARNELRWLCFNTFRQREVERLLLDSLASEPDNFQTLIDLHLAEFRKQLPREGRPFLDQVDARVPGQVSVLRGLAWCDWHTGDQTAARDRFAQALDAAPSDPETRLMAAEWALEQGRDAVCRKLLLLDDEGSPHFRPDENGGPMKSTFEADDRYWGMLGQLERAAGHPDPAESHFSRAMAARPSEQAWVHQRGLSRRDAGRKLEAESDFAEARNLERAQSQMAELVFGGLVESPTTASAARMAALCEQRRQSLAADCWRRWASRVPSSAPSAPR
jgi:tetratricopeptide (TPR) repeat protein